MRIGLVAEPWWVNLAILVPLVAYFSWRRRPVPITAKQLMILGVFASAFGFLEATVVLYLRAAARISRDLVGRCPTIPTVANDRRTASEPSHSGSFSRSGDIAHVELRSVAYIRERKSPCGRFPLGLCPLGHGLLCRPLGDH
jgi:hypothetical protein